MKRIVFHFMLSLALMTACYKQQTMQENNADIKEYEDGKIETTSGTGGVTTEGSQNNKESKTPSEMNYQSSTSGTTVGSVGGSSYGSTSGSTGGGTTGATTGFTTSQTVTTTGSTGGGLTAGNHETSRNTKLDPAYPAYDSSIVTPGQPIHKSK